MPRRFCLRYFCREECAEDIKYVANIYFKIIGFRQTLDSLDTERLSVIVTTSSLFLFTFCQILYPYVQHRHLPWIVKRKAFTFVFFFSFRLFVYVCCVPCLPLQKRFIVSYIPLVHNCRINIELGWPSNTIDYVKAKIQVKRGVYMQKSNDWFTKPYLFFPFCLFCLQASTVALSNIFTYIAEYTGPMAYNGALQSTPQFDLLILGIISHIRLLIRTKEMQRNFLTVCEDQTRY